MKNDQENSEVQNKSIDLLSEINSNLKVIIEMLRNKKAESTKKISKDKNKTIEKKNKKVEKIVKSTNKSSFSKKTYLSEYENVLLLHGNTYDYRDEIKSLGGFWNSKNKGWILSINVKNEIASIFKNISIGEKMSKILKDENGLDFKVKKYEKKNYLDD